MGDEPLVVLASDGQPTNQFSLNTEHGPTPMFLGSAQAALGALVMSVAGIDVSVYRYGRFVARITRDGEVHRVT